MAALASTTHNQVPPLDIDADKAMPAHIEGTDPDKVEGDANAVDAIYRSPFDSLSVWQTIVTFRKAVFLSCIAATITMSEGFEVVVTSSIIVNAGFNLQFGTRIVNGFPRVEPKWISPWGAMVNVGQIVSMLWIAPVADRYGRKGGLGLSWLLMSVSLALCTAARTPPVWLVGRLFTGMGLGIMQVLIVPYKLEIVPSRIRGVVGVFGTAWSQIGGIVCSTMMQQTNKRFPLNWQLPVYIAWGPLTLALVCILVLPETPWHYARRGNKEKALQMLKRINGKVSGYDVEAEYEVIARTLAHEKAELELNKATKWNDLFVGANRRRTFTVTMMALAGQLGGMTLVQSYNTYFFSFANLPDPFLGTVIVTCVGLASLGVFALLTDHSGRRLPIAVTYTCMCLSLWLIGALFYVDSRAGGQALLAIACIWQASFILQGSAYYLFAAELPSVRLRVKTGSINFIVQACFGLVTNFAVPYMLDAIGLRAGFVFGATSIPIAIAIWLFLPETRGRSIGEIDELFERRIAAWRWDSTLTEIRKREVAQQDA